VLPVPQGGCTCCRGEWSMLLSVHCCKQQSGCHTLQSAVCIEAIPALLCGPVCVTGAARTAVKSWSGLVCFCQ